MVVLRPRSGCCQGASLTKSQIDATSRSHRCTAKRRSTFITAHTTVHGCFQGLDIGRKLQPSERAILSADYFRLTRS